MKKILCVLMAVAMIVSMTACGSEDFKRDSKGYLTEDAAEAVAAQSVGYTAKDVAFGVQYHPESSAGHKDNSYLIDKFVKNMEDNRNA